MVFLKKAREQVNVASTHMTLEGQSLSYEGFAGYAAELTAETTQIPEHLVLHRL